MLDDFEHLILKRMDSLKPRRQLGLFDATMIVVGGIVGAGIFANASEVAHRVHTPFLILGVWVLGGIFAMWGAFIWAELATRLPGTGGQYLYLREAYHPAVAFVYGWGLLLVTQTGGMAAVAVIFASYFRALTGVAWNGSVIAAVVLLGLAGINCRGARAGSNVQSVFMLLRIAAIAGLVIFGFALGGGSLKSEPLPVPPFSFGVLAGIGSAMVPVAFAYGGWQTATFVAGEMRDARRDLSRGLLMGVAGVVALYLAVNFVCLRVLGPAGLEVTVDFIFFAMTATSLFVLRRRQIGSETVTFRVPGHPFTTILFVLFCVGIVGSAIVASPANSAVALGIMLAALPVYYYWRKFRRAES